MSNWRNQPVTASAFTSSSELRGGSSGRPMSNKVPVRNVPNGASDRTVADDRYASVASGRTGYITEPSSRPNPESTIDAFIENQKRLLSWERHGDSDVVATRSSGSSTSLGSDRPIRPRSATRGRANGSSLKGKGSNSPAKRRSTSTDRSHTDSRPQPTVSFAEGTRDGSGSVRGGDEDREILSGIPPARRQTQDVRVVTEQAPLGYFDTRATTTGMLPPPLRTAVTDVSSIFPPTLNVGPAPKVNVAQSLDMSTPQSEVDGSLVDSVLSRNQVLPLRRETQRLVKANNALHLHLIAQNEAMDAAQREADSKLRALAAAQSDLKFLFMQKSRKVEQQEAMIASLQAKLREVVDQKAASDVGREAFELKTRLDPGSIPPPPPVKDTEARAMIILRAAQARVESLVEEVSELRKREERAHQREEGLVAKIALQQKEVERLSSALSSQINWDKLQCDFELRQSAKQMKKLQTQIDFLNGERVRMEHLLVAVGIDPYSDKHKTPSTIAPVSTQGSDTGMSGIGLSQLAAANGARKAAAVRSATAMSKVKSEQAEKELKDKLAECQRNERALQVQVSNLSRQVAALRASSKKKDSSSSDGSATTKQGTSNRDHDGGPNDGGQVKELMEYIQELEEQLLSADQAKEDAEARAVELEAALEAERERAESRAEIRASVPGTGPNEDREYTDHTTTTTSTRTTNTQSQSNNQDAEEKMAAGRDVGVSHPLFRKLQSDYMSATNEVALLGDKLVKKNAELADKNAALDAAHADKLRLTRENTRLSQDNNALHTELAKLRQVGRVGEVDGKGNYGESELLKQVATLLNVNKESSRAADGLLQENDRLADELRTLRSECEELKVNQSQKEQEISTLSGAIEALKSRCTALLQGEKEAKAAVALAENRLSDLTVEGQVAEQMRVHLHQMTEEKTQLEQQLAETQSERDDLVSVLEETEAKVAEIEEREKHLVEGYKKRISSLTEALATLGGSSTALNNAAANAVADASVPTSSRQNDPQGGDDNDVIPNQHFDQLPKVYPNQLNQASRMMVLTLEKEKSELSQQVTELQRVLSTEREKVSRLTSDLHDVNTRLFESREETKQMTALVRQAQMQRTKTESTVKAQLAEAEATASRVEQLRGELDKEIKDRAACEERLRATIHELEETQKQVQELQVALVEAAGDVSMNRASSVGLTDALKDAQGRTEAALRDAEEKGKMLEALRDSLRQAESTTIALRQALGQSQAQVTTVTANVHRLEKQLALVTEANTAADEEVRNLRAQLADAEQLLESTRGDLDKAMNQLSATRVAETEVLSAHNALVDEVQTYREVSERAQRDRQAASERISRLEADLHSVSSQLDVERNDHKATYASLNEARERINSLAEEIAKLRAVVQTQETSIKELESEANGARAAHSSIQASHVELARRTHHEVATQLELSQHNANLLAKLQTAETKLREEATNVSNLRLVSAQLRRDLLLQSKSEEQRTQALRTECESLRARCAELERQLRELVPGSVST